MYLGDYQKVEIVFISLDKTEKQYAEHRAMQPWLAVPFESDVIDRFKDHYRVMHADELCKYGKIKDFSSFFLYFFVRIWSSADTALSTYY
jgi:hypothetical protein